MDVSCSHREDFRINQKQLPHISPRSYQSSQETIQESTVPQEWESILNSLPIATDMPKRNQQRTFHDKKTEQYWRWHSFILTCQPDYQSFNKTAVTLNVHREIYGIQDPMYYYEWGHELVKDTIYYQKEIRYNEEWDECEHHGGTKCWCTITEYGDEEVKFRDEEAEFDLKPFKRFWGKYMPGTVPTAKDWHVSDWELDNARRKECQIHGGRECFCTVIYRMAEATEMDIKPLE